MFCGYNNDNHRVTHSNEQKPCRPRQPSLRAEARYARGRELVTLRQRSRQRLQHVVLRRLGAVCQLHNRSRDPPPFWATARTVCRSTPASSRRRAGDRSREPRLSASYASRIPSGGLVFHLPRVKSGMKIGLLPLATLSMLAPTIELHAAASVDVLIQTDRLGESEAIRR